MDNEKIKKSALIIAALNSFITPFMGSATNIALPIIEKQFHINAVMLSWLATSYLLSVASALVPAGRLADIHGRKKIFTWGVIIFTISSILCALSHSAIELLILRIFQGLGNAMVFATGMAILVSVFPPQERGRAIGINAAVVYFGLSMGPFLGGVLTQYLTWRSVFLFPVPISFFILFLIFSRLKGEWKDAQGEKFDLAGSLIYVMTIICVVFGISLLPDFKRIWIAVLGLIGMILFVRWELHVEFPVFEVRLFRINRVFAFSSMAAMIHFAATFALTFLLSIYLQHIKALSPQTTGLILIAQPLVMVIIAPYAGRLSDRIEPAIISTIGMSISAIGLFLLVFIDLDTSYTYIIGCLIILGIGFGVFSPPNSNAIMSSVEKRFLGIASGTVGTMRTLGMTISMGIATVLFSVYLGRVKIIPELYPQLIKAISMAFVFFSLFCVLGIFASMVRGNLR